MKQASPSEAPGNPITVLMYHAVDESTAPGVKAGAADPHYTVLAQTFGNHVSAISGLGARGVSVLDRLTGTDAGDVPSVAITFDDGHASNRRAAEVLAAANMTADFFVNPSTIGSAGFLAWVDLREMLQLGMSIQSHGMAHRYLSDLSPADVRQELTDSKAQIEQHLGAPVTIFAPPGGRMPPRFAQTAAQAGYRAVCSSEVGYWRPAGRQSADDQAVMVPRLAVLNATDSARFQRWITGDKAEMWKLKMRGALLQGAKRAIGNQRYDRLRQAMVGGAAP